MFGVVAWALGARGVVRPLLAGGITSVLIWLVFVKALGVVLLAGSLRGLVWCEYSPPEIKQAVVGTGAAEKGQVGFMVTKLLSLQTTPKPDDVSDALAIAITHAFRSRVAIPAGR